MVSYFNDIIFSESLSHGGVNLSRNFNQSSCQFDKNQKVTVLTVLRGCWGIWRFLTILRCFTVLTVLRAVGGEGGDLSGFGSFDRGCLSYFVNF